MYFSRGPQRQKPLGKRWRECAYTKLIQCKQLKFQWIFFSSRQLVSLPFILQCFGSTVSLPLWAEAFSIQRPIRATVETIQHFAVNGVYLTSSCKNQGRRYDFVPARSWPEPIREEIAGRKVWNSKPGFVWWWDVSDIGVIRLVSDAVKISGAGPRMNEIFTLFTRSFREKNIYRYKRHALYISQVN